MKRFFRIALSTASMYVVTHAVVFLLLPIALVLGALGLKDALRSLKIRLVRTLFWIVGKQVHVSGLQHIEPGSRYLIVSNYPSFYTPFVLMERFPNASLVAHAFISRIPALGHLMRQNGAIFVDARKPREAVRAIDEALSGDLVADIIILPEGQRSPDGQVHPFKRGFVRILRRSTLDLLPVTMNGFYTLKPVNRAYMDPDTELDVVIHKPIGHCEVRKMDDRELIGRVWNTISAEYRP